MKKQVYQYLKSQPEYLSFVRMNPIWYRYLSRDPLKLKEIPVEAKKFYGQTFSKRIESVTEQLKMIEILLALLNAS